MAKLIAVRCAILAVSLSVLAVQSGLARSLCECEVSGFPEAMTHRNTPCCCETMPSKQDSVGDEQSATCGMDASDASEMDAVSARRTRSLSDATLNQVSIAGAVKGDWKSASQELGRCGMSAQSQAQVAATSERNIDPSASTASGPRAPRLSSPLGSGVSNAPPPVPGGPSAPVYLINSSFLI